MPNYSSNKNSRQNEYGQETGTQRSSRDGDRRKQYLFSASMLAVYQEDGAIACHSCGTIIADSEDSAMIVANKMCLQKYPVAQGFYSHHAIVNNVKDAFIQRVMR